MTTASRSKRLSAGCSRASLFAPCALGALLLTAPAPAWAADTNAAPRLTPEQMFEGGTNAYNNWIEFSAGGLLTHGDAAQAEQVQHVGRGAFGGIEDLHFQQNLDKTTTFTLDGRSIFDQHDYKLSLSLKRENVGFIRAGFENFRTWSAASGGFFPPDNLHFSLPDSSLALDRGQVFVEAGWTPKDLPKIVFKYTHTTRDGEKSSTIWGPVQTSDGTRRIYPGLYDIDEKTDAFQLDVTHRIKATDLALGVRYETGSLNDALKTTSPNLLFGQQNTDRQDTTYDMFSVHASTETWIKKNLMLSSGFLFANLDDTFTGSSYYGDDFDVIYNPALQQNAGYQTLSGTSHKQEYVLNLNLFSVPLSQFTIVPSLRVQKDNYNIDSTGIDNSTPAQPFNGHGDSDQLDVRERVDLRYTGITNWVLYAGPEWTEGSGNLNELGGLTQFNGSGPQPVQRATDDSRFFQKYFLGTRWYPTRRVTVDVGGYYKDNAYDYTHTIDSTPNGSASLDRYPAYLVMQGFSTYDGNVRLTLRPVQNVTLVTRYEYQYSTIRTTPDPVSGLSEVDSSKMTSQIFAQNVSWTPWSRLSLQLGFTYVLSDTRTPASDFTQAVLNAQNNYWTLTFNSSLVLDDKTDLNLGFFCYQSDNFQDNSVVGLPLGASDKEYGVTAALTRRLSRNVRLNLRYGYTHLDDIASGGFNNYDAQLVFASIQYRF